MIRSTLIITFALAMPACSWAANDYNASLSQGAAYLASMQSIDGGWQSSGSAARFLETAEATLALQETNTRSSAYYNGITWLENHAAGNIDYQARRILALLNHNASTTQYETDIQAAKATNNGAVANRGYGLSANYKDSPLDTALALRALKATGATSGVTDALAYLKNTQRTTDPKGWPVTEGGVFDAAVTANVLIALNSHLPNSTLTTPIANGVAALQAQVTTDSPLRLRALAAFAYLKTKSTTDTYATGLINSLVNAQNQDGHWGSGVYDTALVMRVLAIPAQLDLAADRTLVGVPDELLRGAINRALGRNSLDQLNRGELAQLTALDISNQGITSLTGLEYAKNLATLNAANNSITDTSPLTGLTHLASQDLTGNPCPGCTQVASNDGDVPLPAWALLSLGAGLMGALIRGGGRRGKVTGKTGETA
ncbi:MAG: hypothetical protein Q8O79_03450 [Pseudomonadota bacterium]|nr:hypothetical protein [Pseudomonadota bacterium]